MSGNDSMPAAHAEDADPEARDPLVGQPLERVRRDGVEYTLLGTAHVSRASVDAVRALVEREPFDAIAVELCPSRARAMRDPEAFRRMDVFQVIRQRKVGMVVASLALASYQKRLAEQLGIEPGAEMKAAMDAADARALPLWQIDREIGTTLKRSWRGLSFGERMRLLFGIFASVFERTDIGEEDIERLKQGDLMEGAFAEFAKESASLYEGLIRERDRYMAAALRANATKAPAVQRVLVVLGAGHLAGTRDELETARVDPDELQRELDLVPRAARWPKIVAAALIIGIFAAILYAFHRDAALGADALKWWVLLAGGGAALGAMVSLAHPLSILAAFIVAPLKPFRPGVPPGAISALVESWLRRPRVGDFDTLRDDLGQASGWWRNRVARTLLNFLMVNLGALAGESIAGIKIVKALLQ